MIREVLKIMPIPIKHYYFFVLSVSVLSFLEISFWAIFSLVISVSPPDLPSHLLELDSFDLAYLLLIVICSRFIFQLFHAWLINKVGFDYLNFIRDFIVDKIIKSKFSDFESIGKAKATNDITLNTAVFVDSVILNIMKIVSDLFNLIIVSFIVIYIFGINSLIVIVSLLFMGFLGGLFLRKKFIKWSKFIVNVTNDFNKLTDYLLYSIKEIKVNNLGNSIFSKHNLIHQQISKTQIKIRFTQIAPRYFVEAIFFSSIALFLIYVGSDQNEISSEILSSIAFIVVAGMRALPLVNQIMISYNGIKAGSGSGIQILTHLKKLSSSKSKSSKKYISKKFLNKNDILTFENVSFSFGKNKVISNLSFNLQAGEIVLFFGPSGSGKSTALDLILGLREVNSGIVNVKKNLNFYYVSQHPFFPSCSVSDYFSALTPNTNWKNVSKVLKQLNLNFLANNPDYYLGEAASNLSGGQRQLLALSSIIIREPDVIVFDETTSGLDSENELKFLDIVKNNFSKSLVLMISHRDTSKDIASKIINFPC